MGLSASFIVSNFTMPLTGRARAQVMSKEHMQRYEAEHKQILGPEAEVDKGGQPDQGTGWYARDLDYKDQIFFLNK